MYAFSENFVLPLSHDEVVHGKGSLLDKMPGDRWQQFANLRALYAYMWAHPGKKLLFMGGELAQEQEWSAERLARLAPARVRRARGRPRARARPQPCLPPTPALWERDFDPAGFRWLEANDAANNVLAFARGRRRRRAAARLRRATSRRSPRQRLPRRAAAWRPLARGAQHRLGRLRRQRRRQRRRRRGRGGAVARQPFSAALTLPPARRGLARRRSKENCGEMRLAGTAVPARCDVGRRGNELLRSSPSTPSASSCACSTDDRETRLELQNVTAHNWHGYLPGVGPGQRYGYRVHGPYDPATGHRFNPASC